MPKLDSDTKMRILNAAEKVFLTYGLKGTRTTMIAEEAGISRTMLHYHYSTKEALFEEILNNTFKVLIKHLNCLAIAPEMSLSESITNMVNTLYNMCEEKPELPNFIVRTINESPELLQMMTANQEDKMPTVLQKKIEIARQTYPIAEHITGENLTMDILVLTTAAFLGYNYAKTNGNRSDDEMQAFVKERRAHVLAFLHKGIGIEQV